MGHADRPRLHYAFSLDAQSGRLCLSSARRRNPITYANGFPDPITYANSYGYCNTYRNTFGNADPHLPGNLYDSYCHGHDNRRWHRYRQPLRRLQHADQSALPGERIRQSADFSGVCRVERRHAVHDHAQRQRRSSSTVRAGGSGYGGPFLNTLFPYYDDLRTDETDTCADCGIFTQTLGTAPNRQFVIRWKTTYFNLAGTAEFEVLLTEGSDTLSAIYGASANDGATGASGIQQDLNVFTSFSCMEATSDTRPACGLHTHKLWQSHADSDSNNDTDTATYTLTEGYTIAEVASYTAAAAIRP